MSWCSRCVHQGAPHLLLAVPDNGQVEELAPVLLGEDGVEARGARPCQLIIQRQVICCGEKKFLLLTT